MQPIKDQEHTQKFSRNPKSAGVEENAVCKSKGKRKRVEGGKQNSQGLGNGPNSVSANKLKAREDMIESSTVEQEVNVAANSPDLVVPPKRKKTKHVKERYPEPPVMEKKKVKVEVEVAEPSVTQRSPIELKSVKQDYPTVEQRMIRTVIGLPAPALTPVSKRKGKQPARSLKKSDDRPETLPKSPIERNDVGAAKLSPETTSVKAEVIVREVTSSAPGDGHTKDNGKTQTRDDAPAHPIPEGTNNWCVFF